jgi:prepilin-type processing-associated H-X9-DG protein
MILPLLFYWNPNDPIDYSAPSGQIYDSMNFGSCHANSANFVFCDGAVHSISYEIDPALFTCLGCRSHRSQSVPAGNYD